MILKFKNFIIETECKITHFYNGQIELKFEINQNTFLTCETPFETLDNRFIIKQIDDNEVTAELDFTSLKSEIITKKYDSLSLGQLLEHIYSEWTISNAQAVTIRRTLEVEELNKYQMLEKIAALYKCTFEFNIKEKRIKVVTIANDRTDYIINNIDYQIKSDTYKHFTKIIGYGKDNMTIADINEGSPFLTNFEYNQNEILYLFKDERFIDKESLKSKMQELLNENCKPFYEYQIETAINSNLKLHDEVLFFNDKLKIREKHRIIETVLEDEVLTIKLANRTTSVVEYMNSTIETSIRESAVKQTNFFTNAMIESNNKWNEYLTSGHTIIEKNAIYFVDKLPKEKAVNVLKIGLGGIQASTNGFNGNYNNVAINLDGSINADLIRVGKISSDRIATNSITTSHLTVEAREELKNEFTNSEIIKELKTNTTPERLETIITEKTNTKLNELLAEKIKEIYEHVDGELELKKEAVLIQLEEPEDKTKGWINPVTLQLKVFNEGEWRQVNSPDKVVRLLTERFNLLQGNIATKEEQQLLATRFLQFGNEFSVYRDILSGNYTDLKAELSNAKRDLETLQTTITHDVHGTLIKNNQSNVALRLGSDRMSFLDNGVEVAYMSNQRLFITSGVFVASLQIGKFKAFHLPGRRTLTWMYVGD